MSTQYKLILVGDSAAGKSSWVRSLRSLPPLNVHIPTMGVEVHPITLPSTGGKNVIFKFWDTAGDPRFIGLGDGYYINSDCAIVLQTPSSSNNTPSYISSIRNSCGDIPILVVDSTSLSPSTLFDPLNSLTTILSSHACL